MSKGSTPRPSSVDNTTFDNNWDAIFSKPDPKIVEDAKAEDEAFDAVKNKITLDDKKA